MGIINCKKCGKMFNYILGDKICPVCKEKAEEKFQQVKKFVSDNKRASIQEICEECEVDQRQITQWIREERLFFTEDSMVKINCERCGAVISTGRFCANCKRETMNNLSNAARRPEAEKPNIAPQKGSARMHIK